MYRSIWSSGRRAIAFVLSLFALFGPRLACAQTVNVGDIGIAANAAVYIAIDKGYFAEEKIDVKLVRVNSGPEGTSLLSTNQIQVLQSGISAALFNAFGRDWPIKIVLPNTRQLPGLSSNTLILRNDLREGVKSVKDLKGKRIAVNGPWNAMHFMVGKMLESGGLGIGDVSVVYLPFPDMGPALQTNAIDGAAVSEPFIVQFQERKLAFPYLRASDVLVKPRLETAVMLFNRDWISSNPEQAKAFCVAYLKGARDYLDMTRGGPQKKKVIDIIAKYTTLKDTQLYERVQWPYIDPNGEVLLDSLREQQDWLLQNKAITSAVNVDSLMDRALVEYALSKIGRVAVQQP